MFHIALYEPEIAGNAGSIARTCLATGATLHLIRPLGFRLNEGSLKRAGMDYWREVDVRLHASYAFFVEEFQDSLMSQRVFALTTKGVLKHSEVCYQAGDVLLFGPESRGLPEHIRTPLQQVRIPMQKTRSLNLAVSAAIVTYEAWRQLEFVGTK
ncbi:MAG: tRNA (cytidine(34)-2'-O)-methyltransferase [Trueperaceae bacterium]